MEYMTNQQVFDKVLEHSRQMTEQCYDEKLNSCAYRDGKGNKCFVGALIPDELYNPAIESTDAENAIDILYMLDKFESIDFLNRLQTIHDSSFDNREEKLMFIAKEYGLNYTPPTQN